MEERKNLYFMFISSAIDPSRPYPPCGKLMALLSKHFSAIHRNHKAVSRAMKCSRKECLPAKVSAAKATGDQSKTAGEKRRNHKRE